MIFVIAALTLERKYKDLRSRQFESISHAPFQSPELKARPTSNSCCAANLMASCEVLEVLAAQSRFL